MLTEALIVDFKGFKGNFTTEVMVGPGMYQREIDHGIVILATGAQEYKTDRISLWSGRPGHNSSGTGTDGFMKKARRTWNGSS